MKVKQALRLGAATVLSLSSLLAIATPNVFAAGVTLYWCSTSDGNFSNASNWNTASDCTSGTNQAPSSSDNSGLGDDLVFDNTSLTGDITVTNDTVSLPLAVNSITFQGSGTNAFTLDGGDISLEAGITDTTTASNVVQVNMNLLADQTFSSASGTLEIDSPLSGATPLALGTNNLTLVTTTGFLFLNQAIAGSGNVIVNAANGLASLFPANSGFSGTTTVNSGTLTIGDPASLGTGAVTVDSGATLEVDNTATTFTLSNPLNLSGTGVANAGAVSSCLDDSSACDGDNSATNLTLSGAITLQGNTTIGVPAGTTGTGVQTVTVTGALSGAFTLTAAATTPTVTLAISSSANTSNTPNNVADAGSAAAAAAAPKTPNTGLAAITGNPLAVLGSTVVAAFALVIAARRLKPAVAIAKRK